MAATAPVVTIHQLKTACSSCSLHELCLPMGISREEIRQLDQLVVTRKRVRRGENLYHTDDRFHSVYAVRSGFFKSTVLAEDGRDQIIGFYMPAEIMGMDGIGTGRHACDVVALENSEVCIIPFANLEEISTKVRGLQRQFHKLMSREIVRDQAAMMLLGSMRAEERLAAFLLNLSQRLVARGYSSSDFNLRMTREEIGSFLGLQLETVSRLFSKFQEERLIDVQQKHIRILDVSGLTRATGKEPC
jgi:CRP/FNR family transcriptional regulator, anaerobic regulatory protein